MRGADARGPQSSDVNFPQAIASVREEFIKRMGN
ncbi:unnamed protein product [Ectocarpus sp. 12 AP-2014]